MEILETFPRVFCFPKSRIKENGGKSKIGNVGNDLIYRRFGEGEGEGNIEVEWKQHSLFPAVPVIECFVTPSSLKLERKKNAKKSFALSRLAHKCTAVSRSTI